MIYDCLTMYLSILLKLFRFFVDLIITIVDRLFITPEKGKLPPITDRLLLKSAVELTDQIKLGKIKSETLLKAYIERIKAVQPYINAMVDERFAAAIVEAIEIDKRVEHELARHEPLIPGVSIYSQPLLGIPISCKDSIDVEGLSSSGGLLKRRGVKAKQDAPVIQLLRKSGAIPLVLSNVPEIVMYWDTSNKLYGRTNNPYDLSRIPGGSSGGEGALVSSAGSLIGVGSDIGGSIRIPSFCCGLFGHKPTPGIVSLDGQFPATRIEKSAFQVIGPIVRYAEDILPTLKAMAGPNARKLKLNDRVDLSEVRVYYAHDDRNAFNTPVKQEIRRLVDKVVAHMSEKYSSQAQAVQLEGLAYGYLISCYALMSAGVPSLESELAQSDKLNIYCELVKSLFNASQHTFRLLSFSLIEKLAPHYETEIGQKYLRMGRQLKQDFEQLLGSNGVFVFPTQPEPAVTHYSSLFKFNNCSYTWIFNALGFPATHCPLGLNRDGLPIGVQIVSAPYNDHLTIAVANEIEEAFGGWVSPSKVEC